jgi:hypothetical protein
VVSGVTAAGDVVVHDPYDGRGRTVDGATFERAWSGTTAIGERYARGWQYLEVTASADPVAGHLPGGVWQAPADVSSVTGRIDVSVRAYPTKPADPPIDHVNVTAWWPALGNRSGPWKVACRLDSPTSGDTYACTLDPVALGAPPGTLALSFDVYDRSGAVNYAPNGERQLGWSAPTPTPRQGLRVDGSFSKTGSPTVRRAAATATLLSDGRVLLAGGCSSGPTVLQSAEVYDPGSGIFRATGQMSTAHCAAAAIRLASGRVLLVGGDSYAKGNTPIRAVEIYDPSRGNFSAADSLIDPRANAMLASLSGNKILVLAGLTTGYRSTTADELFDPKAGTFSRTGSMSAARSGAAVVSLPDGSVLVAGGSTFTSGVVWLQTAELYGPSGSFRSTGSLARRADGIASVLLKGGKVLLAGGREGNVTITDAQVYDPATGRFTLTGPLRTARAGAKAIALASGDALVLGGDSADGTKAIDSIEVFDAFRSQFVQSIPLPASGLESAIPLSDNAVLLLFYGAAYVFSLSS